MTLFPYPVTALALSDAQGTDNKNIVEGAVIQVFDSLNATVTLYDGPNQENPQTQKVTAANGVKTVWLEAGVYRLTVDGANDVNFSVGVSDSYNRYNVKSYGAAGDGSQDDAIAISGAIEDIKLAGGGVLYFPAGVYAISEALDLADNMHIQGEGMFQSVIKRTEQSTESAIFLKQDPNSTFTMVSMDGVTLEGIWDNTRREGTGSLFSARNLTEAYFTNARFMNGTAFGLNINRCNRVVVDNCRAFRVCRDAIAVWATFQTIVTNNIIYQNDDDAISLNNESLFGTLDGENVKSGLIIANNTLIDSGAIRVQQAKDTVITGNVIERGKGGSGIYIGAENAGQERLSNPQSVIIANNVITNQIDRSVSTEINPSSNFRIGIKLQGISNPAGAPEAVGEIDLSTGKVLKPYGSYYNHTQTANNASIQKMSNIVVHNNIIKRTLPAVAQYSDWGYGRVFTRFSTSTFAPDGFVDPEITEDMMEINNIRIEGPTTDTYIKDNIFAGGGRFGIFASVSGFDTQSVYDLYWNNVHIENNVFEDFSESGVDLNGIFSGTVQNVHIRQNVFNGDPNFRDSGRGDLAGVKDGSWISQNNLLGVDATNVGGAYILENTFKNLSSAYVEGGGNNKNIKTKNIFVGEPAAGVDANSFSTSNKGLGLFPFEVTEPFSTFIYEDSDPTSATYGQALDQQVFSVVSAPPSTGFYFRGQTISSRDVTTGGGTTILGFRKTVSGVGSGNWLTLTTTTAP